MGPTAVTRPGEIFAGLPSKYLLALLVFAPISTGLYLMNGNQTVVFALAGASIIPLAALISSSTEELAKYLGSSLGALLNATFGNAAELILTVSAVAHGELVLVRASITGSIVANILLGLGAAMLLGGLRYRVQQIKAQSGELLSTMLFIAVVAILTPSLFEIFLGNNVDDDVIDPSSGLVSASLWLSGALLGLYVLSLVFTFKTHKEDFADDDGEEAEAPILSRNTALTVLIASTLVMAWQTDVLLDALEPAIESLNLSKLFVGVIFLPLLGNAGEYFAGVTAALKNRIGVSAGIAVGASNQVIFFVMPVLVFVGLFMGHPMPFVLSRLEILAVAASALIAAKVMGDGTTNWLEGAQLLVTWMVLAITFFYLV
jgi:Ca2+:H+ antiporter